MNRLTTTVNLPSEGVFRVFSDEEREQIKYADKVSQKEIYRRLQEYENTGLTPDEIRRMMERLTEDPSGSDKIDELEEAIEFIRFERDNLKAENARLHILLDDIENVLKG